jgi:hypothetical protein
MAARAAIAPTQRRRWRPRCAARGRRLKPRLGGLSATKPACAGCGRGTDLVIDQRIESEQDNPAKAGFRGA